MKQYWEIKNLHQDKVLFFRMGDFFELFYDDAVLAAPLLGLTLTQRNRKSNDDTPMCGLPHHAVGGPINKLLSYGHKVAICDQLEDPKMAKGIVKRGVTRILTPGMVFDPESLDAGMANYIACFEGEVLALAEPTTGEAFYFTQVTYEKFNQLKNLFPVAEWVFNSEELAHKLGFTNSSIHSALDEDSIPAGIDAYPLAVLRLYSYLQSLVADHTHLLVKNFELRNLQSRMHMNPQVLRHLEIFETYKGEKRGSFFWAINKTQSALGSRLLRDWLSFPLTDTAEIERRHLLAKHWVARPSQLDEVRSLLRSVGDIERRLARVAQSNSSARDLLQLATSLEKGLQIVRLSQEGLVQQNLLPVDQAVQNIFSTIVDEPPAIVRGGYMIRKGVDTQLDEWIELSTNVQGLLVQMEVREKETTGIPSLKIRYNNVFGYYIEVTHTHKDKVPAHYMRKQTLAQAERYCTDELVEIEKKVLSAESKRFELEYQIFEELRKNVLSLTSGILSLAKQVAEIDVTASSARLLVELNYHYPQFHEHGHLIMRTCRHPVVEQVVNTFTPNDIEIQRGQVSLITGPNMAGKSTLMRQVALNVLLAQIGFPVACTEAQLPIFDCLYTRIGASDQLSDGLSTFMVEMQEAGFILKYLTPNSLVVLDEIGRGTSTYDGLSLAQAILEYILAKNWSYTFFATHYHELTALAQKYPGSLNNYHMGIREVGSEIKFLHTMRKGPAAKSYGIHVARLAGLPDSILKKAQSVLKKLESQQDPVLQMGLFESLLDLAGDEPEETQPEPTKSPEWIEDLIKTDVNHLTPIAALQLLSEIKEKALGVTQGPVNYSQ